jgi:hypothetical protein
LSLCLRERSAGGLEQQQSHGERGGDGGGTHRAREPCWCTRGRGEQTNKWGVVSLLVPRKVRCDFPLGNPRILCVVVLALLPGTLTGPQARRSREWRSPGGQRWQWRAATPGV